MTRLILTCLINEYNEYFSQFLNENGDENINKFEQVNNNIFDEIISFQSIYFENGQDLINSFSNLLEKIKDKTNISNLDFLNFDKFQAPNCFISEIFETNLNFAKENNDILSQIKYLTYYNYVKNYSSNISGLNFILFLMNPTRNGIKGNDLKNISFQFATNSSEASNILFDQIIDFMKNNAMNIVNKSDLISSVQTELDNFKNISIEYNNSRNNLENSIKNIQLNFNTLNFDHAKQNYDPLSTYLSQFKYYDKR